MLAVQRQNGARAVRAAHVDAEAVLQRVADLTEALEGLGNRQAEGLGRVGNQNAVHVPAVGVFILDHVPAHTVIGGSQDTLVIDLQRLGVAAELFKHRRVRRSAGNVGVTAEVLIAERFVHLGRVALAAELRVGRDLRAHLARKDRAAEVRSGYGLAVQLRRVAGEVNVEIHRRLHGLGPLGVQRDVRLHRQRVADGEGLAAAVRLRVPAGKGIAGAGGSGGHDRGRALFHNAGAEQLAAGKLAVVGVERNDAAGDLHQRAVHVPAVALVLEDVPHHAVILSADRSAAFIAVDLVADVDGFFVLGTVDGRDRVLGPDHRAAKDLGDFIRADHVGLAVVPSAQVIGLNDRSQCRSIKASAGQKPLLREVGGRLPFDAALRIPVLPGNEVLNVALGRVPLGRQGDVVGDGRGEVVRLAIQIPAAEGIADLGRCGRLLDGSAVLHGDFLVRLRAADERHLMFADLIHRIHGQVGGNLAEIGVPADESIPRLLRRGGRGGGSAVVHLLRVQNGLAVQERHGVLRAEGHRKGNGLPFAADHVEGKRNGLALSGGVRRRSESDLRHSRLFSPVHIQNAVAVLDARDLGGHNAALFIADLERILRVLAEKAAEPVFNVLLIDREAAQKHLRRGLVQVLAQNDLPRLKHMDLERNGVVLPIAQHVLILERERDHRVSDRAAPDLHIGVIVIDQAAVMGRHVQYADRPGIRRSGHIARGRSVQIDLSDDDRLTGVQIILALNLHRLTHHRHCVHGKALRVHGDLRARAAGGSFLTDGGNGFVVVHVIDLKHGVVLRQRAVGRQLKGHVDGLALGGLDLAAVRIIERDVERRHILRVVHAVDHGGGARGRDLLHLHVAAQREHARRNVHAHRHCPKGQLPVE